jgi:hypothetical protein
MKIERKDGEKFSHPHRTVAVHGSVLIQNRWGKWDNFNIWDVTNELELLGIV